MLGNGAITAQPLEQDAGESQWSQWLTNIYSCRIDLQVVQSRADLCNVAGSTPHNPSLVLCISTRRGREALSQHTPPGTLRLLPPWTRGVLAAIGGRGPRLETFLRLRMLEAFGMGRKIAVANGSLR